ncbi:hypothetical protein REPUB_Repub11eG0034400 [Reevesia pubescens]
MANLTVDSKSSSKYMHGSHSYEYSTIVKIKGQQVELVVLTIFTSIDLSNNYFQGMIPGVIGKLNSLKGLNLSHNNFFGHIPPSIGNLTNLEWLDLSSNKIIGEIPEELVDLGFKAFLNLSKNQLVGPIPKANNSAHLKTAHMKETLGYVVFHCQKLAMKLTCKSQTCQ